MGWSNLGKIVYKRTYSRNDTGVQENFQDTVKRVIEGNIGKYRGTPYLLENEEALLHDLLGNRKAGPAGRGWWFSGAPAHKTLGGTALSNCHFTTADEWMNYVYAQDLLMLGGGVGMSVEHRFVSKLPRVKRDVSIVHKPTKDADWIIPDSREGWCLHTQRVLESYFVTGASYSYSTVCIRGYGEDIKGFGGKACGPLCLVSFTQKLCALLDRRAGKAVRTIDAGDILCAIAEMVVAGNVRRSALILLGDPWDKEFLKAKRWDLGQLPSYRSNANFSVIVDEIDDLHPLFWKTYEQGEPFGLINRRNIQTYGRMGEEMRDTAVGVNPCAEIGLEAHEQCNLQEIALPALSGQEEFNLASRLMHRWGKRVTCEKYHQVKQQEVISRNRRIGTGITGCLRSPLFTPENLDEAYKNIQEENVSYSALLNIPVSIRTTTVKPSGTISKMFDQAGYEGIHPAYSKYIIQRVRFAADDALIPLLRAAGHRMEPITKFDGTVDQCTVAVEFYERAPDGYPVADEEWSTWKQLDVLKLAQRWWSDNSVSITVYYKRSEIHELRMWLEENYKFLKSISFLCHSDHQFSQAPKEAITKEQYEKLSSKVKPLEEDMIAEGSLESMECEGGFCPAR